MLSWSIGGDPLEQLSVCATWGVLHRLQKIGCAGGLVVSAGGPQVCVWDVLGGGRLLHRLSNYQKTVTCLCLSPAAGPASAAAAPRLLVGSLDGHVKVCNRCLHVYAGAAPGRQWRCMPAAAELCTHKTADAATAAAAVDSMAG